MSELKGHSLAIAQIKHYISDAVFLMKFVTATNQIKKDELQEMVDYVAKTISDFYVDLGENFCIYHLSEMNRSLNEYLKYNDTFD